MAKKSKPEVKGIERFKVSFNNLPKEVKVLIYGGINALFTVLAMDIDALQNYWWAKYLAIVVGVAINLSTWKLLQEKGS